MTHYEKVKVLQAHKKTIRQLKDKVATNLTDYCSMFNDKPQFSCSYYHIERPKEIILTVRTELKDWTTLTRKEIFAIFSISKDTIELKHSSGYNKNNECNIVEFILESYKDLLARTPFKQLMREIEMYEQDEITLFKH